MQTTAESLLIKGRVRRVVVGNVRQLAQGRDIGDADSLYEAGMDSHASVNLMIALEAELGIDFPNSLLKRSVFTSIESITQAVLPLMHR